MLYKTISAKTVIQRVMSRFRITDSNLTYDAIDWIGSCMALIGTHTGYINKIEEIEVDFHKIHIPDNFYQLNFIVYQGNKLKYGKTSKFLSQNQSYVDNPLVVDLVQSLGAKYGLIEAIENTDCCDSQNLEDLSNKENNLNNRISQLFDAVKDSPQYCGEHWFSDGESCYNTSLQSGIVFICYKAYPLDSDGFPMVVDEEKYLLALEWYIVRCLMEGGYKHPVLDYGSVDIKTRNAISHAANEHRKMSYEEAEVFTGNWTNMLFRLRENNPNYYSN